jgi:hypothetical protein
MQTLAGRLGLYALALFVFAASGCDVLFPEFAGHPAASDASANPDGSPAELDGGSGPHLSGQLCLLADVRDFRTCSPAHAGNIRLTVEETGDTTLSAADGTFTLTTTTPLSVATVLAVDPSGQLASTVTAVHPPSGSQDALALPLLTAATQATLALQNGFALDPSRGALLMWAIDASGTPLDGATAGRITVGNGPFYDGAAANQLAPSTATGPRGLIALFNLPSGNATLALTPPPPHAAINVTLPIRPAALTMTTVVFP